MSKSTLHQDVRSSYRPVFYALVEQGLTSLINFAMVLVLLVLFSAEVLGQFTYIFTLVMIISSLQYGLVLLPTLVHVAPLGGHEAAEALDVVGNFELIYRAAGTAAITGGTWFITDNPWELASAAAFGLVFMWRETARSVFFATGRVALALRQGLVAFVLFVPALAGLLMLGASLTAPLLAFAASNAVPLAAFAPRLIRRWVDPWTAIFRHFRRFSGIRWSLISSAANEVQMRVHVFAVEALRGVDQLGLMEAGRVLWSPLTLAATALYRLLQPRIAKANADGEIGKAKSWVALSCTSVLFVSALYMAAIYFSFDMIASYLFRDRYPGIGLFVAGWAIYSLVLMVNWNLIVFLNGTHAFYSVAMINSAAAAGTAVLLLSLFWPVPLITVIAILTAIQLSAFCFLLWLTISAPAVARPAPLIACRRENEGEQAGRE